MNLTKKFFQRTAIYLPFIVCITLLTFNPPWQEFLWWAMGVALMYTSRLMYNTLVYYTGAIPSEYYSVQKRLGYKDYQKQTAMFFPSLPKK